MNMMEQQIWDYLDGTITGNEREKIAELIKTDLVYKNSFAELLALHQQLGSLELDEPSMSFTRNVMEKVAAAPLPIKSVTDKRIIYGIAAFFLLSILTLLGLVFSQVDWVKPVTGMLPNTQIPEIDFSSYVNVTILRAFFFVDLILVLYILDSVMREQMFSRHRK